MHACYAGTILLLFAFNNKANNRIFPACPLRFGAASLEMQRTLLCAMHSRACADPRRSSETLQRGEHAST